MNCVCCVNENDCIQCCPDCPCSNCSRRTHKEICSINAWTADNYELEGDE